MDGLAIFFIKFFHFRLDILRAGLAHLKESFGIWVSWFNRIVIPVTGYCVGMYIEVSKKAISGAETGVNGVHLRARSPTSVPLMPGYRQ